MAIDYVLLRPRIKDNSKRTFLAVSSKTVNTRTHKKLGLYDPVKGCVEEWCFKEDFEHFNSLRTSELDQG